MNSRFTNFTTENTEKHGENSNQKLRVLRGFLFSVPSVVFSLLNESGFPLVVLGLGSNLGDSRLIVLDAVKALSDVLVELRAASLYETAPLYVTDQGSFINTAVAGFYPEPLARGASTGGEPQPLRASAEGSARKLLGQINEIEARFGRDRARERRWGERPLDIDILLFGGLTLSSSDLEIPHPRLKERRFALQPLLELLPDAQEPGTGISYRSVCDSLPDQGVRILTISGVTEACLKGKAEPLFYYDKKLE